MKLSDQRKQEKNSFETLKNSGILPVTAKTNPNYEFLIGGCSIKELVKDYGTPLYIIDEETIRRKCNEYLSSLHKFNQNSVVTYAAKAFACKRLFKIISELGLGLDVVSGGELYTAIKSNFNPQQIYFHGNNKSQDEIEMAIDTNVGTIICDNFLELELINKIAKAKNKSISIFIRLTPGIECHTHEYIKTGHLDSKFGFDPEHLDEVLSFTAKNKQNIILKGFHSHIGSQIFELKPYEDTIDFLLEKIHYTKEKYNLEIAEINIGGGIGISYTPSDDPIPLETWTKTVTNRLALKSNELKIKIPKLICEPGRSIIAQAGVTIYTAGSIKQVPGGRKFISVDGGMADNPRPITYQARYEALVGTKLSPKDDLNLETVTIAGRYCESGDILIQNITLPKIESGDLIIIFGTGAYNYSMSSNYNMVPRPACILLNNGKSEVIIERETYEDLISKHK